MTGGNVKFSLSGNRFHARCHIASLICAASVALSIIGCNSGPQSDSSLPVILPTRAPRPSLPSPVSMTDATKAAGIDFKHNNGAFGLHLYPESNGGGVAFIDFDNDGNQDIFFVNGRDWTKAEINAYKNTIGQIHRKRFGFAFPEPGPYQRTIGALYKNNGNSTFADVTAGSGLDVEMLGMGVAVGDYDNDGKNDLYVTGYGRNYLFHNESGVAPKFREIAAISGVQDSGFGASAAWVDYDKDGWLDLFTCRYIDWKPTNDIWAFGSLEKINGGYLKAYSGPPSYDGQASHLYRNLRNGRFANVSAPAGIYKPTPNLVGKLATQIFPTPDPALPMDSNALRKLRSSPRKQQGKSLGVAICDYNKDDWPDIFVTNDTVRNYLFENQKNGTFKEVAEIVGIAFGPGGAKRAGMGVDFGDIDHSGYESAVIGNFMDESHGLYQNQGGLFSEIAFAANVAGSSKRFLTFGCLFLDVNNDSWLDILSANGHVRDTVETMERGQTHAQRPLLYINRRQNPVRFDEVGRNGGPALNKPVVGRGLACADFDLDGDLDVILATNGGRPILMRNDLSPEARRNNVLRLVLQGTRSNRSAIGALVEATIEVTGHPHPITLHRTVKSGSSYQSQSELPLTLGLAGAKQIKSLMIRWPSGQQTQLQNVTPDEELTVREGTGIIKRRRLKR